MTALEKCLTFGGSVFARDVSKTISGLISGLLALEPDPEKRQKYVHFVDIYAGLRDVERERYQSDRVLTAADINEVAHS